MVQGFTGSKVHGFKGSRGSKVQRFTRVRGFVAAAVVTIAFVPVLASQDKKTDDAKSVAGTWDIELMSHQVALVLEQDGTKVTGTLMMMGNDLALKGDFVEGKLTLVGVKSAATNDANHRHTDGGTDHGAGHPDSRTEARPITATLMEDGTLEGEMQTNRGPVKWTAERLKKRK